MPFESKDIRAVYDSLTVDPLFANLNKPFNATDNTSFVQISPYTFRNEIDYYRESRRLRLNKMYEDMENDPKYNTKLKYVAK